jgi:hypothetical protein
LDEELISYILARLDYEYNSVVSALVARPDELTIGEVYSQLMSYEQRIERQQQEENYQASVNAASRGRGTVRGCMGMRVGRSPSRGTGHHPGRPPDTSNRGNSGAPDTRPKCQLCFKRGHLASEYWHKFDENYVPDESYAGATSSYTPDANWYLDTGAIDHITGELEKLAIRERYKGKDQIHEADGQVWKLIMLIVHLLIPPTISLSLMMFFTSPKHIKTLFLSTI